MAVRFVTGNYIAEMSFSQDEKMTPVKRELGWSFFEKEFAVFYVNFSLFQLLFLIRKHVLTKKLIIVVRRKN